VAAIIERVIAAIAPQNSNKPEAFLPSNDVFV
jgi:hypothetical protein